MSEPETIKLLKALAVTFSKAEVLQILDLVGGEFFRRDTAFTSGEAVHSLVDGLARALREIPADARGALRELVAAL
jgi:hypothetical protein